MQGFPSPNLLLPSLFDLLRQIRRDLRIGLQAAHQKGLHQAAQGLLTAAFFWGRRLGGKMAPRGSAKTWMGKLSANMANCKMPT
jgi:hypothetical protein